VNTGSLRLDGAADDGSPLIRFQSFFSPGVENTVADTYGRNWRALTRRVTSTGSRLAQRVWSTPLAAVTRRQFHRDHVRRGRRPQGVAVLGNRAIVCSRDSSCDRCGSRDSSCTGHSLLLCPRRRRLGVDGLVQGSDRYWADTLRRDDRLLCGNVASTLRRYADGFLGAFSRSRGCWGLRIKTIVAVLAAEASGCI